MATSRVINRANVYFHSDILVEFSAKCLALMTIVSLFFYLPDNEVPSSDVLPFGGMDLANLPRQWLLDSGVNRCPRSRIHR